jgi:glycosyltransferase involved in cell wall biosynthesis
VTEGPAGILFVVGSFDDRGGLQLRIGRLARALARRREVTVLTWAGRRPPSVARDRDGVRVVRLPALGSWDREYRPPVRHLNAAIAVAGGLAAAIALRGRWGIAYASGLSQEGLVAALAARLLGREFFLETWLPGERGNVARLERAPLRGITKRTVQRATGVIAGTDELAEELVRCGFPPARVRVVLQGIPLSEFAPPSADQRARARRRLGLPAGEGLVVYHGRFDLRQKRLDLLLDGWRRARLRGWRLLLVGEGADRPELERRRRGMASVMPTLGWQEDVRQVLAAADLFVLPTEAEATGTAMIEAMACGLTGAVSATPWYRRLEPAGVELVPNEPGAWAEALARLTGDPDGRAERGARARRWVERRYDITQTVASLESIFEQR